jgi:hypothetical protein
MKRLLDCDRSDLEAMTKAELLTAIRASEGRVIVSEVIGAFQPLLHSVTNAEVACAFGADILLLNMFDVFEPVVNGLTAVAPEERIRELKRLTGRIVGVNLEPVADESSPVETVSLSRGRRANAETARRACELGADFVMLTGNPATAVSNRGILKAIGAIREAVGDRLIIGAGKMHAAGIMTELGEDIITQEELGQFRAAGADIILLPAPGTVPGITPEAVRELVRTVHRLGGLAMTAIGTSQEGADEQTIRQIALMCKMTGTDLHHLGDAGFPGMAVPENIMSYSIAIRGKRHTYARMARSVNR